MLCSYAAVLHYLLYIVQMKWDNENVCNQYTNLIAEKAELLPDVNPGCVHNKTAAQDVINRMSKDLKETIHSVCSSIEACQSNGNKGKKRHYWNMECSFGRDKQRFRYHIWVSCGRP